MCTRVLYCFGRTRFYPGKRLKITCITLSLIYFVDCTCSLPSAFSGSWLDSRVNGNITISALQVTQGWELTVLSVTYETFSCLLNDSDHWVFRSDAVRPALFGFDYYAVLCLQYTKITDNSYSYYLLSNKDPSIGDVRVKLVAVSDIGNFKTISDYCSPANGTNGPDGREFNVLVKKNTQNLIHVNNFPDPLLGVFYYTVINGTPSSCGTGSVWDGCYYNHAINRTTLTLNYTQCATTLMGSKSGQLYHVASVYYGGSYYTILINADGTDTLFTCIAVSQTGNQRSVSSTPGSCNTGQVSTSLTSDPKSKLITMTAYETCLLTTTTSTTSTTTTTTTTRPTTTTVRVSTTPNTGASTTTQDSNTTAAVVGAVLSLLLLILIIIIAYLLYKKYKGTALITHKASVREQPPIDIKKPLPDNDFELSDHPMASSPSVENDMVIEPMTPTDKYDNPMKDLTSYSNPVQQLRPPVSAMWHKPSVPFHDEVKRNLTPLPTKPKLQSKDWHAAHPLPPISGHL